MDPRGCALVLPLQPLLSSSSTSCDDEEDDDDDEDGGDVDDGEVFPLAYTNVRHNTLPFFLLTIYFVEGDR